MTKLEKSYEIVKRKNKYFTTAAKSITKSITIRRIVNVDSSGSKQQPIDSEKRNPCRRQGQHYCLIAAGDVVLIPVKFS